MKINSVWSISCAMMMIGAGSAQAQTTINKANNTTALNSGGAWTGDTAPTGVDTARWESTVPGANSSALGGNVTWGQILITNPGGAITIANTAASTLTLNGVSGIGIDMSVANQNLTISDPVTLGGAQTWSVASSRTLNIPINYIVNNGGFLLTIDGSGSTTLGTINNNTATLTGSGGLTKNGSGNMSLSGLNTGYSGTTTLNGGVTMVTAVGAIGTGNLTLNGGVYEEYWGNTFIRGLGNGVGQVQLIGGASGFSENGSTGMTIKLGNATATVVWGALGEGAATGFFNPSTLVLESAGAQLNSTLDFQNGINLNGATRTIASYKTSNLLSGATISGAITGSASGLIKEGSGILILSNGGNTYNGTTTISAGTLQANSTSAIGNSSAANTLIFNGGTLRAGGAITSVATRGVTMTATGIIDNNGQAISIAGNIDGAGGLTKNGAGTLTLSGTATYGGVTTVNVGTLVITKEASLASNTAANLNVKNGTALQLNVDSAGTAGFTTANLSTLLGNILVANTAAQGLQAGAILALDTATATGSTFTQGNAITDSTGAFGGVISLTKLGAGTLILDKANTYTGPTTISAGTIRYDDGCALSTRALFLNGGTFAVNGTGTITQGTNIPAIIGGTGSLDNLGSGTLVLNAPTYHTGTTKATAGTITLSHANAIQSSALDTTGAGFVTLSGITAPVFGGLANSGTTRDLATVISTGYSSVTNLTLNPQSGSSFTYSGVIANGASGMHLTKTGAGTQVLQGANIYSGATYLTAGTLTLSGNGSILNTAINLSGGGLLLSYADSDAEKAYNRVSNTADITANGGTITYTTTTAGSIKVFDETLGSVKLTSGQMNIVESLNKIAGSQTLTLTDLTHTGTGNSSAVMFSSAANRTTYNQIVVSEAAETSANQIISPWATIGTTATLQTDYAIYNGSLRVVDRNIAASAQSTWANTTDAYTRDAVKGATTLTGTRNITALRNISVANTVTFTANNSTITLTSHTLSNGDAVVFGGTTVPTGLTAGTVYFVVNQAANTFQVSATSGGGAITPTTAGTAVTATGGILLPSFNLGTLGILNGVGGTLSIAATGTGAVTLPTTTADNLYVTTGSGAITISAPITDNAGILTLVASGSSTLTLSGVNTYTGGTIVNGGTVSIGANNNLGATDSALTFNGSGGLTMTAAMTFDHPVALNNNAVLSLDATGIPTLRGAITGNGGINWVSAAGSPSLSSPNNTFTGNLTLPTANGSLFLGFASIGDGGLISFRKNSYRANVAYTGSVDLVLNNRRIDLTSLFGGVGDGMGGPVNMFESKGTGIVIFNTDMIVAPSRTGTFFFGGSNTGNNTYAGQIPNSTGGTLSISTYGTAKWILANDNTFAGYAIVGGGILSVDKIANRGVAQPLGVGSIIQLGYQGGSGNLEFTGASNNTTDKQVQIGETAGNQGGAGGIINNGTGALAFSAATFNSALAGITVNRTLTLGGNNTGANTIHGIIQNNAGGGLVVLTKTGVGTWGLAGANTYTGTTTVNGGKLTLINPASGLTQTLGTLVLAGPDVTLASDYNSGSGNLYTTFGSLTARSLGNTANILYTGGTVGTDNKIMFTQGAGFIDKGVFCNGASYAAMNALNTYVRTMSYDGVDANTVVADTITASKHVKLTTSPVAQNTITLFSLNLSAGEVNWPQNTSQTLTCPAILKAGGGSSTISGGTAVTAGANTELVIRTDASSDSLAISIPLTQGSGALTKSGAGTLTLSGASTYSGATYVNKGVLRLANATATGTTAGGIYVQPGAAVEFANGITVGAEAITAVGTGVANGGALNNYSGNNTYSGAITLGTGGARINSASGLLTLGGAITTAVGNDLYFGGAGDVTATNVISGVGRVIKDGTGTLTLTANNTYSGATLVNEGTLLCVMGGSCSNSAVTVASAGTLGVSVIDNTKQWACASLALNNGSKIAFNFTGTPSDAIAPLNILGSLTFSGTPVIVVTPSNTPPGTYKLLTVGGTAPTALPTLSGVNGQLSWIDKTLWVTIVPAGTLISLQ